MFSDEKNSVGEEKIRSCCERLVEKFFEGFFALEILSDRYYTQHYLWVKREAGDEYFIGIVHFLTQLVGSVVSVVFMKTPFLVKKCEPCAWIVHREGTFAIPSPFGGEVKQINESLKVSPQLIVDDPYGRGWLLKIKAMGNPGADLLEKDKAREIFTRDFEKIKKDFLNEILSTTSSTELRTLQDGGHLIENIQGIIGVKRYYEIVSKLLKMR